MESTKIDPKRDPPMVSFGTQSKHWPPPEFLRRRPARKQVEEYTKRGVIEDMGNYNIWYGKYESVQGKRGEARGKGEQAETRCHLATDVGRTRGDDNPGAFICYLFAQGRCHLGSECSYLHRVPDDEFDARLDTAKDCFGRTRHGSDSDNMGGVGNFNRESTTLYAGGLKVRSSDDLELRVRDNFGEFGELASVKAFPKRAITFVTYINRASAEFAKIAMADQGLGNGDVLNVRWAYDDPNPKTIELKKRKTQEMVLAALKKRGLGTTEQAFDYPEDYVVPAPAKKKARVEAAAEAEAPDGGGEAAAAAGADQSLAGEDSGAPEQVAGAAATAPAFATGAQKAELEYDYPDTDSQFEVRPQSSRGWLGPLVDAVEARRKTAAKAAEDAAQLAEEEKSKPDAFTAARKEEEEEGGGGANWLRDAAWEAVREAETLAETSTESGAAAGTAAAAGGDPSANAAQWQQWQAWQAYYAQLGYVYDSRSGQWQAAATG